MPLSKGDRGDLLVLGLLYDSPRHGYELKRLLRGRLALVGAATVSTLYYTLRRLSAHQFIAAVQSTERDAGFQPRTVWQLTPAGRQELPKLVDMAIADLSCPIALPLAVLLAQETGEEALWGALRQRRAFLAAEATRLLEQLDDGPSSGDSVMDSLALLCTHQLRNERQWLDGYLASSDDQPNRMLLARDLFRFAE